MACSTKKNTAQTRWWHSFNAKYNTYFNGAQAYIDGSLEKENTNKDNFTEFIPLYTVGNKNSREIGKVNFDRAVEKAQKAIAQHSIKHRPEWNKNRRKTEKDIEWLSRKEYNPFLWKAWMLMGRSQFHKGAFEEAATTFSYMSRLYKGQPAIYGKARAWLAKSYIEAGWLYDADDVIRNMKRDSLDWRAVKEWDYTYADYYIHTGELEKALPYLRKVIKHEMRRKQKAREWYLMGQLQAALGNREEAYKAFKRVIRSNPPYELEFNARIAASEVMAKGQAKQTIARLKRMAASDNNKEYLDQVYYAIGNIYLSEKDTMNAIYAYENGNKKATRNGVEKGVLLLHLGDLYWQKERFGDAHRCYNEALGLLDKDRKDYEQLSDRSKILDELVLYTDAVQLQDSLQYLAKCPEEERLAAIDRVIDALKKKEKEERDKQAEQQSRDLQAENSGIGANNIGDRRLEPKSNQKQNSTWYFYNPMAIQQGKATFRQLWGKRENVDDWQRINKTVVGGQVGTSDLENLTDAQRDSIEQEMAKSDSSANTTDSVKNDPHKREYYLAQIPFTEEQLQNSNKILSDGLHHSGVIFKDRLDNLILAEKTLRRVSDHFPNYEQMDDVYYHLYLLYMRKNQPQTANGFIARLQRQYPKSEWTAILTDPYFKQNALFGEQIEDSLYAATYEAFKNNRFSEVEGNRKVSDSRFPKGANRDKFLFIGGLSKLNSGNVEGCINDMQTVVEKYPQSRLSEMAGMMINGVKAGKRIRSEKFNLDDVWNSRTNILNDSDSIKQVKFTADRDIDFKFLLVYNPDSLNENKLLFEMARFNFTNFLVRNFEIEIEDMDGLHRMQLSGFRNFDEAYLYARQLFNSKNVVSQINKDTRGIIISEKNLQLIGTALSFKDYDEFYEQNFAPLKITKRYLLSEPAELATPKAKENNVQKQAELDTNTEQDFYENEPNEEKTENGLIIPIEIEQEKKDTTQQKGFIIPLEKSVTANDSSSVSSENNFPIEESEKAPDSTKTIIPTNEGKKPAEKADKAKLYIDPKRNNPPNSPSPSNDKKNVTPQNKPKKQPDDAPLIYFNDDTESKTEKKKTDDKAQPVLDFDVEDEYYDLDGF